MELEAKNRAISWIHEVLHDRNFSELDIEFPKYDNRGGYAADVVFANVTGEKDGKKEKINLILKQSKNNEFLLDTLNLKLAYTNELNVYSKILPYIQKVAKDFNSAPFENIPYCYGTISKDNFYVAILENLKAKGYRLNDMAKPQDINHVNLVLQAYAEWHALCFAAAKENPNFFKEIGNVNIMEEGNKCFQMMEKTFLKEIDYVVELYKERGKPHMVERLILLGQTAMKLFCDCMNHVDEKYLVFRHGDCWNNNFLFHYNDGETKPDKVMILDWQLTVPASPVSDVVQYLFYTTSRKELEHVDDLLKKYYASLSKKLIELGCNPEKTFPWKACLQSFKRYTPTGVMGIPAITKLAMNGDLDYDISKTEQDGDMSKVFGTLSDPETYFKKVDSVLELCYERGYF